jgi:hypothetical protein
MRTGTIFWICAAALGLYLLGGKKHFAVLEQGETNHKHTANLDSDNTGRSSTDEGHAHEVVEGKVRMSAGHTHPLRVLS